MIYVLLFLAIVVYLMMAVSVATFFRGRTKLGRWIPGLLGACWPCIVAGALLLIPLELCLALFDARKAE